MANTITCEKCGNTQCVEGWTLCNGKYFTECSKCEEEIEISIEDAFSVFVNVKVNKNTEKTKPVDINS